MEVIYDKKQIEQYIMEILTIGLCKLFLPVSFISGEGAVTGIYNADGYRPLRAINKFTMEDVLNIIIALYMGMWECEKHYIFPKEYDVTTENVYVDKNFSKVKITYNPSSSALGTDEKVKKLISFFEERVSKEGEKYIESIDEFYRENNFGYKGTIRYLENLRREIYLCGVE